MSGTFTATPVRRFILVLSCIASFAALWRFGTWYTATTYPSSYYATSPSYWSWSGSFIEWMVGFGLAILIICVSSLIIAFVGCGSYYIKTGRWLLW